MCRPYPDAMTGVAPAGLAPSAAALLSGVVDYAGLFPPAGLDMAAALREYTRASAEGDGWMLGRFVVPASRLSELREHVNGDRPLHFSVIVTDGSEAEREAIAALPATSVADAIECKARSLESVEWLARSFHGIDVYVEIDPTAGLEAWMAGLAATGLRAKIRTGGIVASAFPDPAAVVSFMAAALQAGVPFKATAGLHHAVRGPYRLTYEPGSADAVMHGYLNVLLAAATLRAGLAPADAERVLRATDTSTLVFAPDAIRWLGLEWPIASLEALRLDGLTGFGSCSIREPSDEIRALSRRAH